MNRGVAVIPNGRRASCQPTSFIAKFWPSIDKIRILVGLNVDRQAFEIIDAYQSQSALDFESHKRTKEIFSSAVTEEMDCSPDSYETELGVRKFIEFLRSVRWRSRPTPAATFTPRFISADSARTTAISAG